MKYLIIYVSFVFIGKSFSQENEVVIIKDSRIDALVNAQSEIIPPEIKPQVDGYRIQLFFDSDKEKLNASRSSFISGYPEIDTYTVYNAPNFFLKAGDFRTRLEAEKIKSEIEAEFPTSFIVKEKIFLPRLKKDDQN
ncbi:MAG: SPOR domain-containing protein [Flavobacteriales bacterium]|nr:SPOR domain-containing protein [Flavobacteriales bacterium]